MSAVSQSAHLRNHHLALNQTRDCCPSPSLGSYPLILFPLSVASFSPPPTAARHRPSAPRHTPDLTSASNSLPWVMKAVASLGVCVAAESMGWEGKGNDGKQRKGKGRRDTDEAGRGRNHDHNYTGHPCHRPRPPHWLSHFLCFRFLLFNIILFSYLFSFIA